MTETVKLGKYEIIKELGRGGFGTVYQARDSVLKRMVALKVLHPELIVNPNFVQRFRHEAELAAGMEHPNIVPIYDFDQKDGRYFIAMGLMPNGSIKDLLAKSGSFSPQQSQEMLLHIGTGLAYAHQRDIIHRDLKPGNILIDDLGVARVSDFGFAKAITAANSLSLSTTGGLLGTPAYMAPEIWEGKDASPQSDIYSLGCIAHEMLTGKPLFEGESAAQIMTQHVIYGPKLAEGLEENWQEFLSKCLAKSPVDRYPSINALIENLHWEILDSLPVRPAGTVMEVSIQETPQVTDPVNETIQENNLGIQSERHDQEQLVINQAKNENYGYRDQKSVEPPLVGVATPMTAKKIVWIIPVLITVFIALLGLLSFQLVMHFNKSKKQVAQVVLPKDETKPVNTKVTITSQPSNTLEPTETREPDSGDLINTINNNLIERIITDQDAVYRESIFPVTLANKVINSNNLNSVVPLGVIGKGDVTGFSLSSDLELLAVGTGNGIYILDPVDLGFKRHIATKLDICDLAFFPNSHLIIANEAWSISIWDADTGNMLNIFGTEHALQGEIALTEDGEMVSVGTYNNWEIYEFNPKTGVYGKEIDEHYSWTGAVHPDYSYEREDSQVVKRKKVTDSIVASTDGYFEYIHSLIFNSDNQFISAKYDDGSFITWSLKEGEIHKLANFPGWSFSNMSPQKIVLLYGYYEPISLWNADKNELEGFIEIPFEAMGCDISPNGHTIAVGTYDGETYLMDINDSSIKVFLGDQEHLKDNPEDTDYISDVAFSPDGRWVASGSFGQSVTVWDTETKEKVHEFKHALYNETLSFSNDSRYLAATGDTLAVWDMQTGKLHFERSDLNNPAHVIFSKGGDYIAVGMMWGEIYLLDPVTGKTLKALDTYRSEYMYDMALSHDGKMIATAGGNGIIRIWGIP